MKRILIVDDEQDHRLLLRDMLEGSGYVCEEAEDGADALARLEKEGVDLVLTDLNMPRIDGLELIELMRKQLWPSAIPVILLTSCSLDDVATVAYKAGVRAVLPKPYDFSRLLNEVKSVMNVSDIVDSRGLNEVVSPFQIV